MSQHSYVIIKIMDLMKKKKFASILIVLLFLSILGIIAFKTKIISVSQNRIKVCKPHEYVKECMLGYCEGGPTREICY